MEYGGRADIGRGIPIVFDVGAVFDCDVNTVICLEQILCGYRFTVKVPAVLRAAITGVPVGASGNDSPVDAPMEVPAIDGNDPQIAEVIGADDQGALANKFQLKQKLCVEFFNRSHGGFLPLSKVQKLSGI